MSYVTDGVKTAGDDQNVTVTVQDANFDVAQQLKQVEDYIAGGYDAIIIKPVDTEGCAPMAAACKEANVPLIVVNSKANCDYNTYVGSDHKVSGELQGKFIAEKLNGKGNILILEGDLSNEATVQRTEGNKEIIAQYPGMQVVSEQEAKWMRDDAMTVMENWLSSGIQFDAVLANNDEMALGAAKVLKEAGITDKLVCGIDASEEGLNSLKDGTMAMTVFQNGYQQGYQGVVAAVNILKGQTVDSYIDVPYESVLPDQADEYLAKIGK